MFELLNEYGLARLEDDYESRDKLSGERGKRSDHLDFATGWIACAVRHNLQAYFTDEAKARLFTMAPATH